MVLSHEASTDSSGSPLPTAPGLDLCPDYQQAFAAAEQARPRTLLYALFAGLIGFALAVAVIHLIIGDPLRLYTPDLSEKTTMLEHLQPHPSAAFGSSMTHGGFDPRVFDESLRGSSLAGSSVNLGVSAGTKPRNG